MSKRGFDVGREVGRCNAGLKTFVNSRRRLEGRLKRRVSGALHVKGHLTEVGGTGFGRVLKDLLRKKES